MSEELIYIVNGKQNNGNKCKNVLEKKNEDRVAKKWLKQGYVGLTMLIMPIFNLRSILFYIVTEHNHPNIQCKIGLISEVMIGIYSDQHHQSYTLLL